MTSARKVVATAIQRMDVEPIFVAEAGSRAWGFASPDSDYDVRFIYRQPINRSYIALDDPLPHFSMTDGDYDYAGWDILKALRLARKSNIGLYEWVYSPITYLDYGIGEYLRRYIKEHYCLHTMAQHYRGVAKSTYKQHLAGTGEKTLKKYLYVLRCLCAVGHIAKHKQFPSINFLELVDSFLCDVKDKDTFDTYLRNLLVIKASRKEAEGIPTFHAAQEIEQYFDRWINEHLQYMDEAWVSENVLTRKEPNTYALNKILGDFLNVDDWH